MIMVITLCVTLVILPVEVAFFTCIPDRKNLAMKVITIMTDIVFMVDIGINFRTGYVSSKLDKLVLDPHSSAIHYLKTWFVIDLLSTLPIDYIYQLWNDGTIASGSLFLTLRILRLTKLLSLLRLLRVARLVRYIYKLEELIGVDIKLISMINLIVMIIFFCHWNGCMQFIAACLQGYPSDCWVIADGLITFKGNVTVPLDAWTMYTRSIWRALSHALGTGYGTSPPINNTDIWMVNFSMLLGSSFYAVFIAQISSILMSMNVPGRKYNEMVAEVKQYMKFKHVPVYIQKRVLRYYEHKYQHKYFNENAILYDSAVLSPTLRKSILMHKCQTLLAKLPVLANASEEVLYNIMAKLQFEVYFPDDIIFQMGTRPEAMYFIERGKVEEFRNDKMVYSITDGNYFGELSIMLGVRQLTTAKAAEVSDIYCLRRTDLHTLLDDHPALRAALEKTTRRRMTQLARLCDDFELHTGLGASIIINDAKLSEMAAQGFI